MPLDECRSLAEAFDAGYDPVLRIVHEAFALARREYANGRGCTRVVA
jgi:hypothetical protein